MLVYTVAGSDTAKMSGDGGPATNAQISSDEGIWMDGECNLFIMAGNVIKKVNTKTGIITTVAGTNTFGYSGDGGPATNAQIRPYGVYADLAGNIYIADADNNRIRLVNAANGIITTFAGGGFTLGDGGPATNAQLNEPLNVYGDNAGNIYIGEQTRIRKVNTSGVITTIAGSATGGFSGDGGPAIDAHLAVPSGMILDNSGIFYFADRGNSIIRKIDTKGLITTIAGSPGVFDYAGDGGPATAAKLSGPISFVIDIYGNMVIGDNQNDVMRKVVAKTGVITTIAGAGTDMGSYAEGVPAKIANMHPEFMYLDAEGNIYYSCFGDKVRAVTNYYPGLNGRNNCNPASVPQVSKGDHIEIYPNPASATITIAAGDKISEVVISNLVGQEVTSASLGKEKTEVDMRGLSPGVYIIKVTDSEGRKTVSKVVKQ